MPSHRPSSQLKELQLPASSPERTDVVETVNARWAPWGSPPQAQGPPTPGCVCGTHTQLSFLLGTPGACPGVLCRPSGRWRRIVQGRGIVNLIRSVLWVIVQLDHLDFFVVDEREVARSSHVLGRVVCLEMSLLWADSSQRPGEVWRGGRTLRVGLVLLG